MTNEVFRDALFEHFTLKPYRIDDKGRPARRMKRLNDARNAAKAQGLTLVQGLHWHRPDRRTFYLITRTAPSKQKLVGMFYAIQDVEDHLGIEPPPLDPPHDGTVKDRLHRCTILALRNDLQIERIKYGTFKDRFALEYSTRLVKQVVSPEGGFSLDELEDFLGWDVDGYIEQAKALAAGTTVGAPVAAVDGLTMGGGAVSLDDLLEDVTT